MLIICKEICNVIQIMKWGYNLHNICIPSSYHHYYMRIDGFGRYRMMTDWGFLSGGLKNMRCLPWYLLSHRVGWWWWWWSSRIIIVPLWRRQVVFRRTRRRKERFVGHVNLYKMMQFVMWQWGYIRIVFV
jgi:hypothetical protein